MRRCFNSALGVVETSKRRNDTTIISKLQQTSSHNAPLWGMTSFLCFFSPTCAASTPVVRYYPSLREHLSLERILESGVTPFLCFHLLPVRRTLLSCAPSTASSGAARHTHRYFPVAEIGTKRWRRRSGTAARGTTSARPDAARTSRRLDVKPYRFSCRTKLP